MNEDSDKTIQSQGASFADSETTIRDDNGVRNRRAKIGDVLLGRYEVLSELGQGGMGVVYRCLDRTGGVEVAVKALPPELSHSPAEMEEVRENYGLVSTLVHQNIAACRTLKADPSTGDYYLVMEYVQGEELRRWMKRKHREGALTLETVLPILRQVADALDFAHRKKVMHRDIKPGNIMVNADGMVKVLDFGLAAQIRSSMSRVSMAYTSQSGTRQYKSPEQWRGQPQGAATDQYALAVTAYKMLAGRVPFDDDDASVLREIVLKEPPVRIDELPDYANDALLKGLAKAPVDRYANCVEFVNALGGGNGKPSVVPSKVEEKSFGINRSSDVGISKENHPLGVDKRIIGAVVIVAVLLLCVLITIMSNSKSNNGEEYYIREEKNNQKPSSSSLFSGEQKTISLPGNVSLEMVKIKAGSFTMGSPTSETGRDDDETHHRVTLTRDYWLGKYEVTQGQWKAVMGSNPSAFSNGDNYPVEMISWKKAMEFCKKLTETEHSAGRLLNGYEYTLPTEAQWEYACRAGTNMPFSFGSALNGDKANCDGNYPYGTTAEGRYLECTSPVGSYSPNAWGLYDMHGNVYEWCRDSCEYNEGVITDTYRDGIKDPYCKSGSDRVLRGGSWISNASPCRSANRSRSDPASRDYSSGFRVALAPVQ